MGIKRRKYTKEFKIEAVRIATSGGRPVRETAENLDISENVLRRWVKQFQADPQQSFPGNGNARDEELARLHAELKRVRMERDILKKATAFFAKESQ